MKKFLFQFGTLVSVGFFIIFPNMVSAVDLTLPTITFIEPTPENSTDIASNSKTIKFNSDQTLSRAFIVDPYTGSDFETPLGLVAITEDEFDATSTLNTVFTKDVNPWDTDSDSNSGSYSLRGRVSTVNGGSWLGVKLEIPSTSTLYFHWKIRSDSFPSENLFSFYLNDELIESISGTSDWKIKKVDLLPGIHSFKFILDRVAPANDITDGAWLDDFYIFDNEFFNEMEISGESSTTAEFTFNEINQGVNYYQVLVIDEAENEFLKCPRMFFNYDSVAPTVVLDNLPLTETTSTSASITVGGDDVISYRYSLDGYDYSVETSTINNLQLSDLAVATYTIAVIGRDVAGNWQQEPTQFIWSVIAINEEPLPVTPVYTSSGGGGGYVPPPIIEVTTTTEEIAVEEEEPVEVIIPQVLGVKKYSNGVLLRSETNFRIYFLIKNQKKYISNLIELKKYKGIRMYNATDEEISAYPDFLPDGTLLRGPDFKIYVINEGFKNYISTLEELKKHKGSKLNNVLQEIIDQYPDEIKDSVSQSKPIYPNGTLLRGPDFKIYVLNSGSIRHIPSLEELKRDYKNKPFINVTNDVLTQFTIQL